MSLDQIAPLIQQAISEGIFPGAVAIISIDGRVSSFEAFGHRMIQPAIKPMEHDTIFDLASLTKPIVVATLIIRLVEAGYFEIEASARNYLPEFTHGRVTLLHLLTHTSGLPAWRPVYLESKSRAEVIRYLGEMPLDYPPGQKVVYSCLGYILLGILISRVTGESLDHLAQDWIFSAVKMSKTRYCPPPAWGHACAATEASNSFEKRMVNYERYDWREGVIVGEVHDENAHFLGGVSGNAGLFSTAEDLAKFCQMLIDGGDGVLNPESIDQMSIVQTVGLNGARGIGWIILEDGSLYHTGFTGTSIRLNLQRRRFAVLLTNRVHPDVSRAGIVDFRDRFHRLVFENQT